MHTLAHCNDNLQYLFGVVVCVVLPCVFFPGGCFVSIFVCCWRLWFCRRISVSICSVTWGFLQWFVVFLTVVFIHHVAVVRSGYCSGRPPSGLALLFSSPF